MVEGIEISRGGAMMRMLPAVPLYGNWVFLLFNYDGSKVMLPSGVVREVSLLSCCCVVMLERDDSLGRS
jgi:hypothetical protein